MFLDYSHRTKLDSFSRWKHHRDIDHFWVTHWSVTKAALDLYLDCGASLAAHLAGHQQLEPAAGEQAEWSAHWDVGTGSQPQGSSEAEEPSSASVPPACSVVSEQKVSGALESAAIEAQHVCLFQELSLGESYLQLVKQHLLKLKKGHFKTLPTNL